MKYINQLAKLIMVGNKYLKAHSIGAKTAVKILSWISWGPIKILAIKNDNSVIMSGTIQNPISIVMKNLLLKIYKIHTNIPNNPATKTSGLLPGSYHPNGHIIKLKFVIFLSTLVRVIRKKAEPWYVCWQSPWGHDVLQ